MSSEYLKLVAAGGEFDLTEAVRQLAKTVTDGPISIKGNVIGGNGLMVAPDGSGEAVSEPVESDTDYIPALLDGEKMEPPPLVKKKK